MTNNMTLMISTTKIRQDTEGRYCLNDCHKAAGADPSKAPSQWTVNKQSKALIAEVAKGMEISIGPINVLNDGVRNGTYAVKELVYAYAMWINPAFHLAVIRAFDSMNGAYNPTAPKPRRPSVLRTFRTAIEIGKLAGFETTQLAGYAGRYCAAKCGENPLALMGADSLPANHNEHTLSPREIGVQLGGLSAQKINRALRRSSMI